MSQRSEDFWGPSGLRGAATLGTPDFNAVRTAKCIREKIHYRVVSDPASLGVVEGHTARGGLIVYHPGNAVRIAFGENADDVPGIESGFRRFAPKKLRPHITDVLRTNK